MYLAPIEVLYIYQMMGLKATLVNDAFPIVSCGLRDVSGGFDLTFSGLDGVVTISVPWKDLIEIQPTPPDGQCLLRITAHPIGFDMFFLGENFLRSAYVLFDYDEKTISLARPTYDETCNDCVQPLRR